MMMKMILVKFNTMQLMKKIISIMMLFAAAAMAFNSCQKQEVVAPEKANEVTLTFSSEKPSFVDESKTEWNGRSIVWSAGDKISVAYTVEGEWMGYMPEESTTASAPKLYKSEALEKSSPTAKFNVSGEFNITSEGTHKFYGVYPAPSSTAFADAPVADLTIPSLQTPKPSSFDASADLMTGVSVGEFSSLPKADEEISMLWTRLVAHANITLKSVNGIAADEKIFSITLTAQDDANLVGKQKVNLLTNEVNKAVASAKTNEVKLNGGNLSIDANRNIEFWACILPATLTSLKVEVDTDKATYTREIKNISKTFKQNARNTLSIMMDGATRVEKAVETWKLVTPAEGITAGTYAFVAKTSTKTGVLISSNGTGSAPTYYTNGISIENDCLVGVSDAMQFDIAGTAGDYVIYVAGGTSKWLYCNSDNNGVRVGTNDNKAWTITTHSNNSDAFAFKHNSTNRYLGVYNDADWRCYTSLTASNFTNTKGSSQIYLYKKTSGSVAPDTTPTLEVGKTEIKLTSDSGEGTVEVTAANVYSLQVRALAEAGSQDEVTWLSVEYDENGTLSYTAEANGSENSREAYIEIYAEDLEGNLLTKYIHVTQAGKVDTSFEPGKYWLLGTKNDETMVMLPLVLDANKDYGYPNGDKVTESRSYEKNAFTFEAEAGGYTIQDTYGKYYYQKANGSSYYNTFNVSATKPTSGHIWTVSIQNDGAAVITNIASGKVVKFADGTYKTFGVYGTGDGDSTNPAVLPVLVKMENPLTVDLSSIAVSGQTTEFTVGDAFEFDGTVTASYTDGSTKTVTPTAVSDPNMTVAGTTTVTVTYAEGNVTKTVTYEITVNSAQSGGGETKTYTVTYTVTAKNTLTVSGTSPSGSSATLAETYSTSMQMTSGNSQTYTLSGYDGCTIKGITMSMKSNSKGGAGTLSVTTGSKTIASIGNSAFNTSNWYGSWSTSYVNVSPQVTPQVVGSGEKIVVKISATANSLYCQSITITYESTENGSETPDPNPEPTTYTYTFTSKAWADATSSWTSGKDGGQMQSGRGVQVSSTYSGANATCKTSMNNIQKVVFVYSTNASAGAGSIKVSIGNQEKTLNVTKTGGTTDRNLEFDFSDSPLSGQLKFTVTCTTNSIYIKSVSITAN